MKFSTHWQTKPWGWTWEPSPSDKENDRDKQGGQHALINNTVRFNIKNHAFLLNNTVGFNRKSHAIWLIKWLALIGKGTLSNQQDGVIKTSWGLYLQHKTCCFSGKDSMTVQACCAPLQHVWRLLNGQKRMEARGIVYPLTPITIVFPW